MERAEGFDKSQNGRSSLPVEVWNGFVFTSFAAAPPPLAPGLAKVDQLLRNYLLPEAVTRTGKTLPDLPWNWKVIPDNFNDPSHARRLHGPLPTFAPRHLTHSLDPAAAEAAVHTTHRSTP